jgi:hypothetical protein
VALTHGDRVLTVAVDEPASDFTDQGSADYGWAEFDRVLRMSPNESTAEFLNLQVALGRRSMERRLSKLVRISARRCSRACIT